MPLHLAHWHSSMSRRRTYRRSPYVWFGRSPHPHGRFTESKSKPYVLTFNLIHHGRIYTNSHVFGFCQTAWLVIERAWDETPLSVNFGKLADLARPIARYWWRGISASAKASTHVQPPTDTTDSSAWRQLTYEEYCHRKPNDRSKASGAQPLILTTPCHDHLLCSQCW